MTRAASEGTLAGMTFWRRRITRHWRRRRERKDGAEATLIVGARPAALGAAAAA